jgi:hypothetical protein
MARPQTRVTPPGPVSATLTHFTNIANPLGNISSIVPYIIQFNFLKCAFLFQIIIVL